MQLSQNDVPDNLRERLFELDASGALVARAPSPPTSARRLQAWLDCVPGVSYLHLVGLGRQLLGPRQSAVDSSSGASVREAVDGQDDQGLRLQRAILVAAVRAVREMGATPLLVTADFSEAAARPVQAFAAELGVRYVRIPGKGERPELYYRIDDHWNAAGHAHVAALLEEELRRPEYGGLYRSMR
jgi:hypothetical protein